MAIKNLDYNPNMIDIQGIYIRMKISGEQRTSYIRFSLTTSCITLNTCL